MIKLNITQKEINHLVDCSKNCKSKLGALLAAIRHGYSNYDDQVNINGFRTANEELEVEVLKLFPNKFAKRAIMKHFDNKLKREDRRI